MLMMPRQGNSAASAGGAPLLLLLLLLAADRTRMADALYGQPGVAASNAGASCDSAAGTRHASYFSGLRAVYDDAVEADTCIAEHEQCGWAQREKPDLPLLVVVIGLEGAGHHLWSTLFAHAVDCHLVNMRHYMRDLADGVPRTTRGQLTEGIRDHFRLRNQAGKPKCKIMFDAEDSFPTGANRKFSRVFMHPDLSNLRAIDGELVEVRYMIITRDPTDTALSALRRNFHTQIELELRTIEHSMTYVEMALRGVPCNKVFLANYEHVLQRPKDYIEPLKEFFHFPGVGASRIAQNLNGHKSGLRARTTHKLIQYPYCKDVQDVNKCYTRVRNLLEEFVGQRRSMWPHFAVHEQQLS